MSLWNRLRGGARAQAERERDLDREIQSHLAALEEEDSGPRAARRAFGNTALVKEDVRAAWGWPRFEQFVRDVRFGFRQIRRNLGFSAMAIATLALGIGGIRRDEIVRAGCPGPRHATRQVRPRTSACG